MRKKVIPKEIHNWALIFLKSCLKFYAAAISRDVFMISLRKYLRDNYPVNSNAASQRVCSHCGISKVEKCVLICKLKLDAYLNILEEKYRK